MVYEHYSFTQLGLKITEDVKSCYFSSLLISCLVRPSSTGEAKSRPFDDLERLNEEKLVSELHPSFVSSNGDMVRSSLNRFNAIILACLVMFR